MLKTTAVLSALSVIDFDTDNLKKVLLNWSDSPAESVNFLFKFLEEQIPHKSLQDLRIAVIEYDNDPALSFNLTLKALENLPDRFDSTAIQSEFFENLRIAFLELKTDPQLAANLFLKAVESLPNQQSMGEIRKALLAISEGTEENAINHILRFFAQSESLVFIDQIRKAIQKFPNGHWVDAFSFGQIESKIWLLDEFKKLNLKKMDMAFILGGWYGLLPAFAEARKIPLADTYRSFDIDSTCALIAETTNKAMVLENWKFKASTDDMHNINYACHEYETLRSDNSGVRLIETPDVIINTSCEHIDKFEEWYNKIPEGKLLILQSNNFFNEPTHINCSKDLEAFKKQCPMKEFLFEGQKEFPKYNRFMLIGHK